MSESLPYLATPGNITKCLEKISNAATPEKVTGDFINTKLGIKGGSGRALVPFLKKIGFVNPDGTPSDLYKRYRNPSESGAAVAAAIKTGYQPLFEVNEYCHELSEGELKGLVVQVTGQDKNAGVVQKIISTFKNLREFSDFDAGFSSPSSENKAHTRDKIDLSKGTPSVHTVHHRERQGYGMNLSYTINLNLPATSDIAVFNAIFKSLRENLLEPGDE